MQYRDASHRFAQVNVPGPFDCDLVADLECELAAQHIGRLVAVVMQVEGTFRPAGMVSSEYHDAFAGVAAAQLDLCLDHLTPEQARAFRIADNRLTEISTWDDRLLAEQLRDLSLHGLDFTLEATGDSGPSCQRSERSWPGPFVRVQICHVGPGLANRRGIGTAPRPPRAKAAVNSKASET